MKPCRPTAAAAADIDSAFNHCLLQADADVALRFIDAIDTAFQHMAEHPATGSPRYARQLEIPGLRCWLTSAYPYAVFYLERETHLDVIRVLHQHADLPAHLR
ncbi:MAG: type II toxin-antitoxin system RelE/ParE family toxin [Hydrogenophaga sp.]|nr:type II toxin-antitoxin system RelE/ParE family toxin [Hydrogenophaga sp.]